MKALEDSWNEPRGMTALELVTVLAILAILSGIAIPGILGGIHRTGVDGASRRLAEDIRLAQSNALTRGMQARLIAFDQTGTAQNPGLSAITDTTKRNMYRIELRSGPSVSWPALSDNPGNNSSVLTVWNDLGRDYRGVALTAGNALIFNTQGFLINSAAALDITLQGSGGTRTVQTSVIGKATIQ
jgi:prepilin-type N-terminal cleavage/methylation domain-containing protein